MQSLQIILTRISPTHHRFSGVHSSGSREEAELETKTYLFHDLLHYAVESEAGLHDSFYGQLAKGKSYAEMSERGMEMEISAAPSEIIMTERVVGVMTGVLRSDATPAAALSALTNLLSASGEEIPAWFSQDFIVRVKERMRRLEGEWKGTPFGQSMTLQFSF